ncbi:MAG: hypothetical protein C0466_10945 [Candidatus Accumulibacter sp.]|nr:hypothetical protein [Accumulibacter sp.]
MPVPRRTVSAKPVVPALPPALLGLCLTVFAAGAIARDAAALWLPHLDVEGRFGNKRNIGEADLFLPLAQDARTLYFANVRTRFDNESGREGNFGLGARRMLENGWNLGTYGYFDRRRSPDTGFHYNQTTLGIEALGPDFDLRANAYVPVGTRTHDLGSTSTVALSGSTVQVTTTTREERSLQGFDAEAGWRLPIFDSEARRQLRVYAGGYHFSTAGITVEGPRARAELAFEDLGWFGRGTAFFVGAEAQHDETRGSQRYLSVRLRVPLGKVDTPRGPLSAQAQRMTAPVVRDVDVVTQSHVASRQIETATTTANGQAFTVITSADAANAAALNSALVTAGNGSTVLLSGTFNTTSPIQMLPNQTLTGALTVRSPSGQTATINTGAAILATNAIRTMEVSSGGTLSGLTLTNTFSGGLGGSAVLVSDGATNIRISDNIISTVQNGANAGIGLSFGMNTSGMVSGNTITVTGSGAATTMTALAVTSGNTVLTVSGNTLSASGGASNYRVWSQAGTVFNPGSTGNIRGSGNCNGTSASGSLVFTDNSHCP